METLKEGDFVAFSDENGAWLCARRQNRTIWSFKPEEGCLAEEGDVPLEAVLVVMKPKGDKVFGFRSPVAEGKVLQSGKDLTLRFDNYNFKNWERWTAKEDLTSVTFTNKQFRKEFSVRIVRIKSVPEAPVSDSKGPALEEQRSGLKAESKDPSSLDYVTSNGHHNPTTLNGLTNHGSGSRLAFGQEGTVTIEEPCTSIPTAGKGPDLNSQSGPLSAKTGGEGASDREQVEGAAEENSFSSIEKNFLNDVQEHDLVPDSLPLPLGNPSPPSLGGALLDLTLGGGGPSLSLPTGGFTAAEAELSVAVCEARRLREQLDSLQEVQRQLSERLAAAEKEKDSAVFSAEVAMKLAQEFAGGRAMGAENFEEEEEEDADQMELGALLASGLGLHVVEDEDERDVVAKRGLKEVVAPRQFLEGEDGSIGEGREEEEDLAMLVAEEEEEHERRVQEASSGSTQPQSLPPTPLPAFVPAPVCLNCRSSAAPGEGGDRGGDRGGGGGSVESDMQGDVPDVALRVVELEAELAAAKAELAEALHKEAESMWDAEAGSVEEGEGTAAKEEGVVGEARDTARLGEEEEEEKGVVVVQWDAEGAASVADADRGSVDYLYSAMEDDKFIDSGSGFEEADGTVVPSRSALAARLNRARADCSVTSSTAGERGARGSSTEGEMDDTESLTAGVGAEIEALYAAALREVEELKGMLEDERKDGEDRWEALEARLQQMQGELEQERGERVKGEQLLQQLQEQVQAEKERAEAAEREAVRLRVKAEETAANFAGEKGQVAKGEKGRALRAKEAAVAAVVARLRQAIEERRVEEVEGGQQEEEVRQLCLRVVDLCMKVEAQEGELHSQEMLLQNTESARSDFEQQLLSAERQHASSLQQLGQAKAELGHLNAKLLAAQAELGQVQGEAARARAERERLEGWVEEVRAVLARSESERGLLLAQAEAGAHRLREVEGQHAHASQQMQAQINALMCDNNSLVSQIGSLQERLQSLAQEQQQKQRKEEEREQHQVKTRKKQREEEEQRRREEEAEPKSFRVVLLEGQVATLQEKLKVAEAHKARVEKVEASLRRAQGEAHAQQPLPSPAASELAAANAKIQALEERLLQKPDADLQGLIDDATQKVMEAEAEAATQKAKAAELMKEVASLKKQVKKLQAKAHKELEPAAIAAVDVEPSGPLASPTGTPAPPAATTPPAAPAPAAAIPEGNVDGADLKVSTDGTGLNTKGPTASTSPGHTVETGVSKQQAGSEREGSATRDLKLPEIAEKRRGRSRRSAPAPPPSPAPSYVPVPFLDPVPSALSTSPKPQAPVSVPVKVADDVVESLAPPDPTKVGPGGNSAASLAKSASAVARSGTTQQQQVQYQRTMSMSSNRSFVSQSGSERSVSSSSGRRRSKGSKRGQHQKQQQMRGLVHSVNSKEAEEVAALAAQILSKKVSAKEMAGGGWQGWLGRVGRVDDATLWSGIALLLGISVLFTSLLAWLFGGKH